MARVLILGGGFGGVTAAEALAREIGGQHQVTLVSRGSTFVFYPALVRLAFGQCEPDDVSFDLRKSMLGRRINFIRGEVARLDPVAREVIIAGGDVHGNIPYDYLIYALGRRLATEHIDGFFEFAHHLLDVDGALAFGEAVRNLSKGRIIIGQCPDARLPIPVYETAFGLSKWLKENANRAAVKITVVSPGTIESEFGDAKVAALIHDVLAREAIEFIPDFPVARVGADFICSVDGRELNCNLAMLLPPFRGSSAASHAGLTDGNGYINCDWTMRALGAKQIYAAGDCVNFPGPKMGHMAVNQAQVAAANVAAELTGHQAVAHYNHQIMMVLDAFDRKSIYFQKDLWSDAPASVRQSGFWNWAKRVHEKYWEAVHA